MVCLFHTRDLKAYLKYSKVEDSSFLAFLKEQRFCETELQPPENTEMVAPLGWNVLSALSYFLLLQAVFSSALFKHWSILFLIPADQLQSDLFAVKLEERLSLVMLRKLISLVDATAHNYISLVSYNQVFID